METSFKHADKVKFLLAQGQMSSFTFLMLRGITQTHKFAVDV